MDIKISDCPNNILSKSILIFLEFVVKLKTKGNGQYRLHNPEYIQIKKK